HAGVLKERSTNLTKLGELVVTLGGESVTAWALMLCNLVYTPQFYWWLTNIDFDRVYSPKEIEELLGDQLSGAPINHASSAFKHIFYTNPILSNDIGFGCVTVEKKGANTILVDASRKSWSTPDPRVILYSLYKFAENCGDYYQFSLTTLLDDTIERDGISPTRIFGLDRDTMVPMLNGLSVNYSEFINASFTLGLDTINLRPDKKSEDVLSLF
ncbi:MAG: phosphoadenosine phosphosulfate reductase, partial [Clostridia bacterium]|nr:phosphoadenosine phosphosulfate reductase [Clostridia bacterium]